jgi:acyl transferase domain-containing protein
VNGSKTSVHVGCLAVDYKLAIARDAEMGAKYSATGTELSMLSNRLSWFFNLKGPSLSVETACSSSLVALDLACQLLRNGDTDMVSFPLDLILEC